MGDLPQDALTSIDAPYRVILDAAERRSSKNTFVVAAKVARTALIAARGSILLAVPIAAQRTVDSPPTFGSLVGDATMQAILESPEKERSHGITLSPDDATMFWELTKTLSRELHSMKGEI